MTRDIDSYQAELIEQAMSIGALKFGSFVLKSGRASPYFFNAGLLSTGPLLYTLASAYASTISKALSSSALPPFDVLFGPAYKGIPMATCTALVLHTEHGIDVGVAYDRKEPKAYAEGGDMVGVSLEGKRVLILDDVMTLGDAKRRAVDMITKNGGEAIGIVLILDREEIGEGGQTPKSEIEDMVGGPGRVTAILKMRDLILWLEKLGQTESLGQMRDYWNQFGIEE